MHPWLFFTYTGLAAVAASFAFVPRTTGDPGDRSRRWLHVVSVLALLPMLIVAWFALDPTAPIGLVPLELWALAGREFWLPLAVLFFACASRLVTPRNRRALRLFVVVLVAFVGVFESWRLTTPRMYEFGRRMQDGVCLQSSGYTCGAAALVTMLEDLGIEATEGEMARHSGTFPGRGVSDFQAAQGLQRKLRVAGRTDEVRMVPRPDGGFDGLEPPFLAGLKHSIWFDHMVCVLEVNGGDVVFGDPLEGRRRLSLAEFGDEWRGVAITVVPTSPAP